MKKKLLWVKGVNKRWKKIRIALSSPNRVTLFDVILTLMLKGIRWLFIFFIWRFRVSIDRPFFSVKKIVEISFWKNNSLIRRTPTDCGRKIAHNSLVELSFSLINLIPRLFVSINQPAGSWSLIICKSENTVLSVILIWLAIFFTVN